jgi:HAD superfamily hydrolase (TIGR01509 family)
MYRTSTATVVLFDCDGVLVDSESLIAQLLVAMANEVGADLGPRDGPRMFLGAALPTCLDRISAHLGRPVPDDFAERYHSRVRSLFEERLAPVAGVDALLSALRTPRAVVSNSPAPTVRLMLRRTGLLAHFADHIYSACDIGFFKPDPHVYRYAAERLGVRPAACVAVEDSVTGVRAAVDAGMTVIGFALHGGAEALMTAGAARICRDMTEVDAALASHRAEPVAPGGR